MAVDCNDNTYCIGTAEVQRHCSILVDEIQLSIIPG